MIKSYFSDKNQHENYFSEKVLFFQTNLAKP